MSQATLQNTVVSLPQLSSLADIPVHGVAVGPNALHSKPKTHHSMNGDNIALGIIGGLAGGAALGAGIYHAATAKLRREGVFIPEVLKAALQSRLEMLVGGQSGPVDEQERAAILHFVKHNSAAAVARHFEYRLENKAEQLENSAKAPNFAERLAKVPLSVRREHFLKGKINTLVAQGGRLTQRQHELFRKIARRLGVPNVDPVQLFTDIFPDDAAQRNALKILAQVWPRNAAFGPNSKEYIGRFYTQLIKPQLSDRNQALYERAMHKMNVLPLDVR